MAKIPYADFIRVGYCGECDGLHMQLHDEKGKVIAVAVLTKEQAVDIGEECAAFVKEGANARSAYFARQGGRLQ